MDESSSESRKKDSAGDSIIGTGDNWGLVEGLFLLHGVYRTAWLQDSNGVTGTACRMVGLAGVMGSSGSSYVTCLVRLTDPQAVQVLTCKARLDGMRVLVPDLAG